MLKKTSKRNNRRAVEAVEDAGTSAQPAGHRMQDRRQAGEGPGLSVRGLLRPEG